MTEENLTRQLLIWLERNDWEIIAYDFPQSGTGVVIHPNHPTTKNLDSFIPDIVAVKNQIAIFFENKARFQSKDFLKIQRLKSDASHSLAISRLLSSHRIDDVFHGVGIGYSSLIRRKTLQVKQMVDFVIFVDDVFNVDVFYDPHSIFCAI